MSIGKIRVTIISSTAIILLSGCVAKDIEFNEQQKRMQRCEQYIDREKERCLQGDHVTIEDYKDDYDAYRKSKEKEAKKAQLKLPVTKPLIKPEDKPETRL
jgi:hypothetical protein